MAEFIDDIIKEYKDVSQNMEDYKNFCLQISKGIQDHIEDLDIKYSVGALSSLLNTICNKKS